MASPFPGMDPYLEDPAIWTGVHAAILGALFEQLGPAMRPRYAVRFAERVFVTDEDDPGYRAVVPDLRVVERDPAETTRRWPSPTRGRPSGRPRRRFTSGAST